MAYKQLILKHPKGCFCVIIYVGREVFNVGRKLIFETKEKLQSRIDEYFEYCETHEKPLTMSGLAYYLNVDRQTIINYANREEFFDTIKRARERVLMDTEERLQTSGQPTTGIIFALKNNYDWRDKVETENTNINSNTNKNIDLSHLSTEEIKELLRNEE